MNTHTLEAPMVLQLVDQPEEHQAPAIRQQSAIVSATPAELLQVALSQGADLDRLERLMNMQVSWEEREAKKKYNEAFAAFKSEAVRVIKNRTVTDGPLKNKRYAELFSWVNAVTPALSMYGLSASWRLTKDDRDWIEVTCTLKHSDGHSESVSMGGPPDTGGAKNAIQARASTVSYLERYTLKAITGLSEQDDDDDGAGSGAEIEAELLQGFREAALNGTEALRKHYDKVMPTEEFWGKHNKALKDAAKLVDGGAKK